ncbi:hypothetical protein GEMRC1_006115 [Eukaryota sp. GEM-RC1]
MSNSEQEIQQEARFTELVDQSFATSLAHVQEYYPVYIAGEDVQGHPVLVVDLNRCDCSADDLFLYLLRQLSAISHKEYAVILINSQGSDGVRLSHSQLKHFYHSLPRSVRKHIVNLFLLRPSLWTNFVFFVLRPFISSKFTAKYHPVSRLSDLDGFFAPVRLQLPLSTLQIVAGDTPSSVFFALPDDIPPERLALVPEMPVLGHFDESSTVPPPLLACFERIVRAESLRTEYLFRSSHAPDVIDSVILWLSLHYNEPIPARFSPAIVASVAKKIVSSLPFSLITLQSDIELTELSKEIESISTTDFLSRIASLVQPQAVGTLCSFLVVLAEVERFKDFNQMTFNDLAFCVASLIIPPFPGVKLTKTHAMQAKDVVLLLLTNHSELLQLLNVQVAVLDSQFLVKVNTVEQDLSIDEVPLEIEQGYSEDNQETVQRASEFGSQGEEVISIRRNKSWSGSGNEQLSFAEIKQEFIAHNQGEASEEVVESKPVEAEVVEEQIDQEIVEAEVTPEVDEQEVVEAEVVEEQIDQEVVDSKPVEAEVVEEQIDQEVVDSKPVEAEVTPEVDEQEVVESKPVEAEVVEEQIDQEVVESKPVEAEVTPEVDEQEVVESKPVEAEVVEEQIDQEVVESKPVEAEVTPEVDEQEVVESKPVEAEVVEEQIDQEVVESKPVEAEVTPEVDEQEVVESKPVEAEVTPEVDEQIDQEVVESKPVEAEVTPEVDEQEVVESKPVEAEVVEEQIDQEVVESKPVEAEVTPEVDEQEVVESKPVEAEVVEEQIDQEVVESKPVEAEVTPEVGEQEVVESKPVEAEVVEEQIDQEVVESKPVEAEAKQVESDQQESDASESEYSESENETENAGNSVDDLPEKSNIPEVSVPDPTPKRTGNNGGGSKGSRKKRKGKGKRR